MGEGEGGEIWENGIETCIISCMKRVASPGSMHNTGSLGLVHWDDPEGWDGKGGGREGQDGAAKSLQLCPILCDPIDGSPPGSPVPGILQAKTLECGAVLSLAQTHRGRPQTRVFLDDARGCQCPFVLCLHPQGNSYALE